MDFRHFGNSVRRNWRMEKHQKTHASKITDYPRFAYRGMHLDVSRHFFDVEFVKTYIDMIAIFVKDFETSISQEYYANLFTRKFQIKQGQGR